MAELQAIELVPFGDGAVRFELPAGVAPRALLEALLALPGAEDAVVTERHACLFFSPDGDVPDVAGALEKALRSGTAGAGEGASHVIPVRYDGADLGRVAGWAGLPAEAVIERHLDRSYVVKVVGFLPGFAYLGDVDPAIAAPRLSTPRVRVPPGSVAIAGGRTGVYPFASPGGWNLIGTALGEPLFDPLRGTRLRLGDRVRFVRDPGGDGAPRQPVPSEVEPGRGGASAGRALEISSLVGPAWIQDGGRPGRRHEGVPPGGALVPQLLAAANAACGNAWDAPAIERFASISLTARGGTIVLGVDGRRVELREGETLALPNPQLERVAYVAVENGLDAPRVLGGAGLLLVAGLGGLHGRPLRRGDTLPVAPASAAAPPAVPPPPAPAAAHAHPGAPSPATAPDPDRRIRVLPGPDLAAFPPQALELLTASEWRVSAASDRTGARLDGPSLPRIGGDTGVSMPMVQGAIQVPAGGSPIVLGPDHPTTGGYPVIATVISADRGALAARRPGARVRFALATPAEARAAWRAHAPR